MKKIFATLLALTILLTALQLSGCRDEIDDPEGTSALGEGTTLESATDGTAKDTTEDTTEDTTAESESEESLYIPESDTWDGSVATSFAKGSGTESDPYLITSAEQLAFLAKEINSGKNYTGKKFSLMCDIDLNNLEWTPIGNGDHSFDGSFDGNEHVIQNLKIVNGSYFSITESWGQTYYHYAAGLFGSCVNSVIKNLTINQSVITIQNIVDRFYVSAGILVGEIRSYINAEVSNITVSNAEILCDFEQDNEVKYVRIGGVLGFLEGDYGSSFVTSQLQSDIYVSIENGVSLCDDVGGIVGDAVIRNLFNAKDCVSYLSVKVDTENCYVSDNYFGAFGYLSAENDRVTLSNMFSKVTVNKIHDYFHGYSAYAANVISGEMGCGIRENGGFEFKNLFGFVEQIDEETGQKVTSMQLFEIPYPEIYTETNCQGCEELPEFHGFDENIWDLTDLKNPKLK